jgi:hypothetical protein
MTTKKSPKNPKKYYCEICDYNTSNIKDYKKHLNTKKHINNKLSTLTTEKSQENPRLYYCDNCDYNTSNIKDYNKHLQTIKHNNIELTKIYVCEYCSKEYKERSGLWRHKQKCINEYKKQDIHENYIITDNDDNNDNNNNNNDKFINVIFELIKQNTEFKDLLTEQSQALIELAKDKGNNNNNNSNNNITNNNNNHFNLQLFLNETCKNAMNINDFIDSIQVNLSDLENTGRLGYVEGITRLFIKGLRELEVNDIGGYTPSKTPIFLKEGS